MGGARQRPSVLCENHGSDNGPHQQVRRRQPCLFAPTARLKEPKKAGHFFGPHLDNPGVTSSDSSPDAWGPRLAILDFDGSAEGWGRLTILDGRSNPKKVGRIFWRRADNSGVQKETAGGAKGARTISVRLAEKTGGGKTQPRQKVRPSFGQAAEKADGEPFNATLGA